MPSTCPVLYVLDIVPDRGDIGTLNSYRGYQNIVMNAGEDINPEEVPF